MLNYRQTLGIVQLQPIGLTGYGAEAQSGRRRRADRNIRRVCNGRRRPPFKG